MASKQAGPGCLVLFGLVFILAGSVPGCIALNDLHTAHATRGWVETRATILSVDLRQGDDTAAVEARYRYRAPDPAAVEAGALKDYEGTRVGVHTGSDNVGSWQVETYGRLRSTRDREETVPCWYDPADPAQAVLDRGERWEMIGFMLIFPVVFGLAGGGIAWLGIHQWRKARRPAPDPQTLATQAVILADRGAGCGLWIMAIIWNAISWPTMIGASLKGGIPWPFLLLIGLFPLIGLAMLWGAMLGTVRAMRHGRPQLRLDAGTWSTGTRVRATLLTRTLPEPGDRIEARLAVTRSVTTGSGDDSRTTTSTLWSLDLEVDTQAGRQEAGQWAHALELPLPSDVAASGEDVTWKLEWQLVRPGPDLSVTFVLPVVAGDGTAELKAFDLKLAADRAAPLAVLYKAGVRVSDAGGEVVIDLPAARNPGLAISGIVATALLSAGALALYQLVAGWTVLLTGPLVLWCWHGALRSLLWRSTITLGQGRIAVSAGWWRRVGHDLRASEVVEVERSSHMSSGETAWFNMWLKTADGERIPIVRAVPGPAAARIAEMIDAVRR